MVLDFQAVKKGPGYWRLNTSLLLNTDYLEKMNKLLEIQNESMYDSKMLAWEMIKLSVRGSTVQFASRKKCSDRQKIFLLERKLKQIQNNLVNCPAVLEESQNQAHQLGLIKREINELLSIKTQGAIIHSQSCWETKGEHPTKYFLGLERKNFLKKTIYRLKVKENVITDQQQILDELEKFYRNLYTTIGPIDENYVKQIATPKLSKEDRKYLDSDVTLKEVSKAMMALHNKKAGGTDGIPIDFYKMFWEKLKKPYFEMLQEAIQTQILPLTARRGIISLMEKLDRDALLLKSWHPLSLLNSDYKIFAKILVMRLQTVLNKIIHTDQTGFTKGRHLVENVMKLLNLMAYCEKNKRSMILLSLEKAFDKLEWQAIYLALESFNVGPIFIQMVKILYTQPLSCSINNGYWSQFYTLSCGARQGCPLSALIFTVTIELLGIKLRVNPEIKGIDLGSYQIKNNHYADDLWVALDPTTEHIDNLLKELEKFTKFSGLTINYQKSVAMIVGPMRDTDAQFYTIKQLCWVHGDKTITILGNKIHPNPTILYSENFLPILAKI